MKSHADYLEAAALVALATYAAANDAPAGTYLYGRAIDGSLEANSAPLPLVLLFDPTTTQAEATGRVSRAACTMYFADSKPGPGDDPAEEAAAVVRMESLKQRFFGALDNNPLVELTQLRATPFHDAYAAKLTGVGVQFTLGVPAATLAAACV